MTDFWSRSTCSIGTSHSLNENEPDLFFAASKREIISELLKNLSYKERLNWSTNGFSTCSLYLTHSGFVLLFSSVKSTLFNLASLSVSVSIAYWSAPFVLFVAVYKLFFPARTSAAFAGSPELGSSSSQDGFGFFKYSIWSLSDIPCAAINSIARAWYTLSLIFVELEPARAMSTTVLILFFLLGGIDVFLEVSKTDSKQKKK
jgi:hypothetical protein